LPAYRDEIGLAEDSPLTVDVVDLLRAAAVVVRDKLDRLRQQITAADAEVRGSRSGRVPTRPPGIIWPGSSTRPGTSREGGVDLAERRILLDMWVPTWSSLSSRSRAGRRRTGRLLT
jgi:hypothetical protein